MSAHSKQIAAINLAIESLKRERRERYAAGEAAYNQGIRTNKLNGGGVTGELFSFAEDGHNGYMKYTAAIQELSDLIEILTDPGVEHAQESLF